MFFGRPPEPDFHPEFGLMCPSSHFRRVVGVAAVSIALGATAGAIAVFALSPHSQSAREQAFNIIFADQAAAANGAAPSLPAPDRLEALPRQIPQNPGVGPAAKAAKADAPDSAEQQPTPKKKKRKVARARRRDDDSAGPRVSGASARPSANRSGEPRRD